MKKIVYFDQIRNRYLLIDDQTTMLYWTTNLEENLSKLDILLAQNLYVKMIDNFMSNKPSDIKIEKYNSNNKLYKKENENISTLQIGRKVIGNLTEIHLKEKDIEAFNKQGGIILTAYINNINTILFFMPFPRNNEKKVDMLRNSIVHQESLSIKYPINTVNESNKLSHKDNDFLEATIKLPKNVFENEIINNSEIIELLKRNEKNTQLFYQDLSNKLSYLNTNFKNSLDQEKEKDNHINNLERELIKLRKEIKMLIDDRILLEKEKEKAELVVLNKIKNDLKTSKLAIDKQIDLEESSDFRKKLLPLVKKIAYYALDNDEDIQRLLRNENILEECFTISDNIDSKMQSLLDIKRNFKSINIID